MRKSEEALSTRAPGRARVGARRCNICIEGWAHNIRGSSFIATCHTFNTTLTVLCIKSHLVCITRLECVRVMGIVYAVYEGCALTRDDGVDARVTRSSTTRMRVRTFAFVLDMNFWLYYRKNVKERIGVGAGRRG